MAAKSQMKLFGMAEGFSIWTRFVTVFLAAQKIPHQYIPLWLTRREQMDKEHLKINPRHKVPFLDDGGFTVFESGAILRYLATKYPTPLYPLGNDPTTLKRRARIDEAFEHTRSGLTISAANLGFQLFFKPLANMKPTEDEVKTRQKEVESHLKFIESHWFRDSPSFMVGTDLSLADLILFTTTEQLAPLQYNFGAYPRLAKWRTHIANTCPFMKDVHKDLHTNAAAALKKSNGFGSYAPSKSAL